METIAWFGKLRELSLWANGLTELGGIPNLTHLRKLDIRRYGYDIDGNFLGSGLGRYLSQLSRLEDLDIGT